MKEITFADFDTEVAASELTVIVDFYAPWCMPCRMMAPKLEEYAGEFSDKVKVVKVDIDAEGNEEFLSKYSIRSVPTLVTFKGGELVSYQVGSNSTPKLNELFVNAANL